MGSYVLNIQDIKAGILKPFKKLFAQKGVRLYLLSNLLWSITPLLQKKAISLTVPDRPLFASFVGLIFTTILILPFVLASRKRHIKVIIKGNFGWLLLIGLGGTLAQLAAFTAFTLTNLGYVSAVMNMSVLFSVLLGALFFNEDHVGERLAGAGIMIAGAILLLV